MTILYDYHLRVNQEKMESVAYWKKHPLSHEESLRRLRHLRKQRLVRESRIDLFQDYMAGT